MSSNNRRKQQQFSFSWDDDAPEKPPSQRSETEEAPRQEQDSTMPPPVPAENNPADERPPDPPSESPSSADSDEAVPAEEQAPPRLAPEAGALGTPRPRPATGEKADEPKAEISTDALEDLSVGQIMQEARGQLNRSIAQVAQRTRIPPSFLYNIEADHLDRLPALIYSKSHVRQLCQDYGLDPEPVMQKFLAAVGAAQPKRKAWNMKLRSGAGEDSSQVAYHLPPDEDLQTRGKPRNPAVLISGGVLAAIALLVLLAIAVQNIRNRDDGRPLSTDDGTSAGAAAGIDYEQFIVPDVLPVKQLPMPGEER